MLLFLEIEVLVDPTISETKPLVHEKYYMYKKIL